MLNELLGLPGVADGVEQAREACAKARWHPALRRRAEPVRAECAIRAAHASARLDGAVVDLAAVRMAFLTAPEPTGEAVGDSTGEAAGESRGESLGDSLGTGPAAGTARGAVRAVALADRVARDWQAGRPPALPQLLARLHLAAAADLLPPDQLGRVAVGREGAERLALLADLLTAPPSAPVLLLAAVTHAELATITPFPAASGVVARAVARAVAIGRGLDPMAMAVWEEGLRRQGPAVSAALSGYASGRAVEVAAWLGCWSSAIVAGVDEGLAVADAVAAGRLLPASG